MKNFFNFFWETGIISFFMPIFILFYTSLYIAYTRARARRYNIERVLKARQLLPRFQVFHSIIVFSLLLLLWREARYPKYAF